MTAARETVMHKLIALYKLPPDPAHFREHYETVHVPLLAKMPGILKMNYSFDIKGADGSEPFFCIFEAYFENADAINAAMQTPEGAAVLADLDNYERNEFWIFNYPVIEAK